jgi:LAO/AO transport system kinase
MMTETEIN